MQDSIWDSTLAAFRDRLATVESVPAGVSTAGVGAAFALGLLTKVLKIASKRKDFQGDRLFVAALIEDATDESANLSRLAEQDIAAFRQRSPAVIEVPLNIVRGAARGVAICEKARSLVHAAVAPDLEAASTLLAAAARAALFSLEANLEQLPAGDPYREQVTAEARHLLQKCETLMPPCPRFRADR
jgi:formiminotetrahydrofolate cyclodeaminase